MELICIGLFFRPTPLAERTQRALPESEQVEMLQRLAQAPTEALFVSTSNWAELYLMSPELSQAAVQARLELFRLGRPETRVHLFEYSGERALEHLFRMTSGLESRVIGKADFLGLMKEAFEVAQKAGAVRSALTRMCNAAFYCARRVHNETATDREVTSIASTAVALAMKVFDKLGDKTAVVVGAGELGERGARHLREANVGRLLLTHSIRAQAEALAGKVGGATVLPLEDLPTLLKQVDVVVISMASPVPIFTKENVGAVGKARRFRPLFMVDLAMPRTMAPDVAELDWVMAYDLEDIQNFAAEIEVAQKAEALVNEEVARCTRDWAEVSRIMRDWTMRGVGSPSEQPQVVPQKKSPTASGSTSQPHEPTAPQRHKTPVQITEARGKVDFGIITIREDEFEAVLQRFPEAGRVSGRRQYNLRRVELVGGGSYLVAVVRCIEQGNRSAQDTAYDLLEDLIPRWMLVVGIAGGVPSDEFGLGDVIVSTRIHDFSVEAILHERPSEYEVAGGAVDKDAAALVANLAALKNELGGWNAAESVAVERPAISTPYALYGDEEWRLSVRNALDRHVQRTQPQVVAGAIASSDRLIKDTDILKVWMKMARQSRAIEMESAGVYQATYGRRVRVPTLSIRGISDIVGHKRDPAWTRYACHTAAAFALALVKTKPFVPGDVRPPALPEYEDEESRIRREQIEDARKRIVILEAAGADTTAAKQELLQLRRKHREGGQLREGELLSARYLLLRRVGRGGFATVWEARDEQTHQRVAVKVLHAELARDPARRERFFRGARVMSELAHAAIVKVLDPYGLDDGYYYFVMEFIPGGDFRAAVLNGQISRDAVIPLILQVGNALGLAHQKNFVHRDIKPANILLDEKGTPRLTDFDLVGGLDTTGGTRTGALGTYLYAAPELLDRPQDADARADVYGLGMTALFGLHGRELSADMIQDTEKKKLINRLSCNGELKKAIQRAVSRAQDKRYPDALKFCRALEEAK